MTTDQACASCIRPSSPVLCKSEKVVVGFQLQIVGFGGSRAVASVRLRTGAFSSGSLVLPVPGRRVPACGLGYLPAHVSIRLLISPHQTRRPTVLPRGRDRDRLCAVCCRRRGACGRTDRALGWPAIGRWRARGQHAWVSLTSVSSASSTVLCLCRPCWVRHLHNAGYMADVCSLLNSLSNYYNVKPF